MSGFITSDGADYLMNLLGGIEQVLTEYYIALVTVPVGTAEAGVEISEPVYPDYTRAVIGTGQEYWVTAYGALTNTTEVRFPMVGEEDWVGIVGWALCDSQMEGRVLYAGDVELFDAAMGDQVVMPPGTITLAMEMDSWRETT